MGWFGKKWPVRKNASSSDQSFDDRPPVKQFVNVSTSDRLYGDRGFSVL